MRVAKTETFYSPSNLSSFGRRDSHRFSWGEVGRRCGDEVLPVCAEPPQKLALVLVKSSSPPSLTVVMRDRPRAICPHVSLGCRDQTNWTGLKSNSGLSLRHSIGQFTPSHLISQPRLHGIRATDAGQHSAAWGFLFFFFYLGCESEEQVNDSERLLTKTQDYSVFVTPLTIFDFNLSLQT